MCRVFLFCPYFSFHHNGPFNYCIAIAFIQQAFWWLFLFAHRDLTFIHSIHSIRNKRANKKALMRKLFVAKTSKLHRKMWLAHIDTSIEKLKRMWFNDSIILYSLGMKRNLIPSLHLNWKLINPYQFHSRDTEIELSTDFSHSNLKLISSFYWQYSALKWMTSNTKQNDIEWCFCLSSLWLNCE